MRMLASHQPDFFPWMGYFYKIFQSDVFVFSDNVQYSKSARHNYNEILTANGPQRFTLPIHYHCADIDKIEIAADDRTIDKMLKTLKFAYGKARCFDTVYPVMEELLRRAPTAKSLADFNYMCIVDFCNRFGMNDDRGTDFIEFYRSSWLNLKNRRDARIIEMCDVVGADGYFSGTAAKDYHIEEDYRKNGINLVYSDYEPLVYEQVGGRQVINMSVIDYVMNCGFVLPKEWKRNEYPVIRNIYPELQES